MLVCVLTSSFQPITLYTVYVQLAWIKQQVRKQACSDGGCDDTDLCVLVFAAQVVANFGGSAFACDVSSLEADALQCIQESLQQTQVPFPVKVDQLFI